MLFLEKEHALVYPVEAVRFRSGAAVRTQREMNVGMPLHGLTHRGERGGVIRVGSDEKVDTGIAEAREIVIEHVLDDAVLLPGGHVDRHAAWGSGGELTVIRGAGGAKLKPGKGRNDVNHTVIETAQDDPEGQRNDQ
jgi:hypothetical protein